MAASPTHIGREEIVEIARRPYTLRPFDYGGMSRLFCAYPHDPQDCKLAVKFLNRDLSDSSTTLIRFQRECLILNQLDHPGVPHFVSSGTLYGRNYLAYELIEGTNVLKILQHRAKTGNPLRPEIATRLFRQLLLALNYLHSLKKPVIHSDISPENLVIDSGQLRLIDFGSAFRLGAQELSSAKWRGKPSYLSPEQARNQSWDHRSDLYQAGIVFYELLSGCKWNRGHSIEDKHRLSAKPEPQDLSRIPAPQATLIERLTQLKPELRFQSAHECLKALDSLELRTDSAA